MSLLVINANNLGSIIRTRDPEVALTACVVRSRCHLFGVLAGFYGEEMSVMTSSNLGQSSLRRGVPLVRDYCCRMRHQVCLFGGFVVRKV